MNPPVEPDLEDCCRSGCCPCVFDLYAEALERYEAWLAAHPEQKPDQDRRPREGGEP
ncbi:MAG TPA: oxidoreductase-like domain-containing protein [Ramlibacter sp.]